MQAEFFLKNGWVRFAFDPELVDWITHTLPYARKAVTAPENQQWLRYGDTWFAGVNVLPNDARGSIENGPMLAGNFTDFIRKDIGLGNIHWDAGQISVCYPGYPKPMESESEAAFTYRIKRDAAHIDGLLPEGAGRRRHLREYHGFILGIPLVQTGPGASPVVVWQGSHVIIREVFKSVFVDINPENWGDIDITEIYQQTRRQIFDQCERVEISAQPGECYLIHRLALHGVSPWRENTAASKDGRMICYFRPEISDPHAWLDSP